MNGSLIRRLINLGFVPSAGYLPHNGSVILFNLEKNWVQDRHRQQSLLINTPPVIDSAAFTKMAKDSCNKSVSFIEESPVYTNYLSKFCEPCSAQPRPDECCDVFDISKLGFNEDKILHCVHFYGEHVAHAGLMEFDQMKECYHKYSTFFRLLHNFNPANFVIKSVSDTTIQLMYKSGKDFMIPLQETRYLKPDESDILVLQSMTFLCNWYLAIILDKFQNDLPPNYSAFHPRLAPYHVGIIPADLNDQDIEHVSNKICNNLNKNGVLSKIFGSETASGELGVPFDVLVDQQCVMEEQVSLLDRKNGSLHVVPNINKLPEIFRLYWSSVLD